MALLFHIQFCVKGSLPAAEIWFLTFDLTRQLLSSSSPFYLISVWSWFPKPSNFWRVDTVVLIQGSRIRVSLLLLLCPHSVHNVHLNLTTKLTWLLNLRSCSRRWLFDWLQIKPLSPAWRTVDLRIRFWVNYLCHGPKILIQLYKKI